ncbi:MAG: hypothetical protein PHW02_01485 [bacterium]|nr:hypothetical protein [bacterium]
MENKSILALCTTGYFNDRGCHIRILQMFNELSKSNSVLLHCYSTGRNLDKQRIMRIRKYFRNERDYIGFDFRKIVLDFYLLGKSLKFIRSGNFDIVYCFTHEAGVLGLILNRLTGLPYWLDYQGSLAGELALQNKMFGLLFMKKIISKVEKLIEDNAEAIVYNTKHSYNRSAKTNKFLFEDDSSVFAESAQKSTSQESFFTILWVGVMTPVQNIGKFIEVSRRILEDCSNVKIRIAGFPVNNEHLNLLAAYGERIKFEGKVRYEDLPAMIAGADLCVSTKSESSEGSSKLHLYKKYAKRILALRNESAEELLKNESLADSFDELEDKIKEIIRNAGNNTA